jgi:hypothetical protein
MIDKFNEKTIGEKLKREKGNPVVYMGRPIGRVQCGGENWQCVRV